MPEILNRQTLTDEELINQVKNGELDCFSEIVKRYNQRLYRIAVSYGIYDDDIEEVIQVAYISAYENLHQFRNEAKFSTWLTRILINECLMLKRKKKRVLNLFNPDSVTIPADNHLNPERTFMDKERKEMLENAIKKLPEKYRSVFILREVDGMSIEEICKALEISKVNVKVRLHRAKSMLKDILGDSPDIKGLFGFGNERCDRVTDLVMDYIKKTQQ